MTMKRKPQPKFYKIQTFQLNKWKDDRGWVRNYTIAANTRAQAIRIVDLQKDEAILSIKCIGNKTVNVEWWHKE